MLVKLCFLNKTCFFQTLAKSTGIQWKSNFGTQPEKSSPLQSNNTDDSPWIQSMSHDTLYNISYKQLFLYITCSVPHKNIITGKGCDMLFMQPVLQKMLSQSGCKWMNKNLAEQQNLENNKYAVQSYTHPHTPSHEFINLTIYRSKTL